MSHGLPSHAELLVLATIVEEGVTPREAAEIVGVPEGRVYSWAAWKWTPRWGFDWGVSVMTGWFYKEHHEAILAWVEKYLPLAVKAEAARAAATTGDDDDRKE